MPLRRGILALGNCSIKLFHLQLEKRNLHTRTRRSLLSLPSTFSKASEHFGNWISKDRCIIHPVIAESIILLVRNTMYLEANRTMTKFLQSPHAAMDFVAQIEITAATTTTDTEAVRTSKLRACLKKILEEIVICLRVDGDPGQIYILHQFVRLIDSIEGKRGLKNILGSVILRDDDGRCLDVAAGFDYMKNQCPDWETFYNNYPAKVTKPNSSIASVDFDIKGCYETVDRVVRRTYLLKIKTQDSSLLTSHRKRIFKAPKPLDLSEPVTYIHIVRHSETHANHVGSDLHGKVFNPVDGRITPKQLHKDLSKNFGWSFVNFSDFVLEYLKKNDEDLDLLIGRGNYEANGMGSWDGGIHRWVYPIRENYSIRHLRNWAESFTFNTSLQDILVPNVSQEQFYKAMLSFGFKRGHIDDIPIPVMDPTIQKVDPRNAGIFLDWVNKGVFNTIQNRYLKALFSTVEVHWPPYSKEYAFRFMYSSFECSNVCVSFKVKVWENGIQNQLSVSIKVDGSEETISMMR